MADSTANSYDEMIYDSLPRAGTHPDCLGTLARLLGLQPAPPNRCRVLEVGCSTGGNLLPMAEAMPDSQFVGIDFSPRQIEIGRKVAAALGLNNLHLEVRSILDVESSLGEFDYILCHGVYSWVPAEVRDKMLSICKHNLAPQGVAYVSYNTYPGWHMRASIREMMLYHVRGISGARERTRQARELIQFLAHACPDPEGVWGRTLHQEAELLREHGDFYIFHEHLEPENHAVYFHELVEHARQHGLQYLAEAQTQATLVSFPEEIQETLQHLSGDLIEMEQYLDFLHNRTFRRTLLVHQEVKIHRSPGSDIVSSFLVAGLARPVSAHPDIVSSVVEEFRNDAEATVSTPVPLAKAALVILFEIWPEVIPFDELCAQACQRVGPSAVKLPTEQVRNLLARSVVHLFLARMVGLHLHVPAFVLAAGEHPETTALIRLQAETGAKVTNRRHRGVEVSILDRAMLSLLDGKRNRQALVTALAERVGRGELELQREGQPVKEAAAVHAVLQAEVEGSLTRLGQSALLIR